MTTGLTAADMRQVLRHHNVTDVHYDGDEEDPATSRIMYFSGIVFDQPAHIGILFEQDRARVIFADIYLRSHALPPFWTVAECRQRFDRLADGLEASFRGTAPKIRSTQNVEIRSWSDDRRYAQARLDIARPDECASIAATWFDGTERELDDFFARYSPQ